MSNDLPQPRRSALSKCLKIYHLCWCRFTLFQNLLNKLPNCEKYFAHFEVSLSQGPTLSNAYFQAATNLADQDSIVSKEACALQVKLLQTQI